MLFRISETGECPRILSARKQGYESKPESSFDRWRLNFYSAMEQIAADQLATMGYKLFNGGTCMQCQAAGEDRQGIHVEIHEDMFDAFGHLDRRVFLNGVNYPLEIKGLGRFSFDLFKREGFEAFPEYDAQFLCYLEAEKLPGLYYILNRDTGDTLRYIINDFNHDIEVPEGDHWERMNLRRTYDDIRNTLVEVVCYADAGELMPAIYDPNAKVCKYCKMPYLCADRLAVDEEPELVDDKVLGLTAENYRKADVSRKEALATQRECVQTFIQHAKTTDVNKFQVMGVVFNYKGERTKANLNKTKLVDAGVSLALIKQCSTISKPYDDFSIKLIGSSEEDD